jgi:CBS domain containing-hemolysin-like protein
MDVYLPSLQPNQSLSTKISVILTNSLFWSLPATIDAFADDVGEYYQTQLLLIVIMAFATTIYLPVALIKFYDLSLWSAALAAFATYLFWGGVYHLNERQWK